MTPATPENVVKEIRGEETKSARRSRLKDWSRRAPFWIIVVSIGVVALLAFLFLSAKKGKGEAVNQVRPSSSQVIPEKEIRPSYLSQFVPKEDTEKKDPIRVEESAGAVRPVPIATVGSMAVFISGGSEAIGSMGIPMGTELSAVIEEASAGGAALPVVARVTEDLVRDGEIKIPKSSRLFGTIEGQSENRLSLRFTRVVLATGEDYPFSGVSSVAAKLKGKKVSRGLSVLSGAALGSTSVFLPQGAGYGEVFAQNAFRGGMGEASRDWNYYRNTEAVPVVQIKANTRITVLVDKPL